MCVCDLSPEARALRLHASENSCTTFVYGHIYACTLLVIRGFSVFHFSVVDSTRWRQIQIFYSVKPFSPERVHRGWISTAWILPLYVITCSWYRVHRGMLAPSGGHYPSAHAHYAISLWRCNVINYANHVQCLAVLNKQTKFKATRSFLITSPRRLRALLFPRFSICALIHALQTLGYIWSKISRCSWPNVEA